MTTAARPRWRTNVRALVRSPALLLWSVFVLLSPLHVLPKGMPQPGDFLILLVAPVTLLGWDGKLSREHTRMVRPLLWFAVWVAIVNYAWALVLWRFSDPRDFVLHPFFYVFNVLVFVAALILARRDGEHFVRVTVEVTYITIVVTVVASFVMRDQYRTQVFFNSPNQLGYYSLLSACLFSIAQRHVGMSRIKASVGVTCCAYLALLSASRASLAGILILLVVLVFSNPRIIIAGVFAAVALVSITGPISDAIDFNQQRALEDRDPQTSFAEERGYDRLWRHPEYLLTGAGEGAYERFVFRAGEPKRELHSSFGSIVFSYGVVGTALFLVFFVRTVRGASLRMTALFIPALVYTVAHQGLRFTTFWIVLAVFVIIKMMPERQAKVHAPRLSSAA